VSGDILDEARAAAEAASVGPWRISDPDPIDEHSYLSVVRLRPPGSEFVAEDWIAEIVAEESDATFIAGARQWVPALCDEVEALRVSRQAALDALADTVRAHESITARFRAGIPKPPPEWAFKALDRARALIERESHRGAPAPVVLGDQAEEKQ
jgi:hypothetical protein